jgi:hypothetical protein
VKDADHRSLRPASPMSRSSSPSTDRSQS